MVYLEVVFRSLEFVRKSSSNARVTSQRASRYSVLIHVENMYFELIGTCYESCKRKKKKERKRKEDGQGSDQSISRSYIR